jgi:membrane protein implicated in regulation of membrane protease activity
MTSSDTLFVVLGALLGLAAIAALATTAIFVPDLAPLVAFAAFAFCALYLLYAVLRQAQADLRATQRHNLALSDRPPAQGQAALEAHASSDNGAAARQPRVQRFAGQ